MSRPVSFYILRDEKTKKISNIARIDETGSYAYECGGRWVRNNGLVKIENEITDYEEIGLDDLDKAIEEYESNKTGLVYVITNPRMPGLVKIGETKNLKQRLIDLDTTGVPESFEPYFTVSTVKYKTLEKVIHRELSKLTDTRVSDRREFFEIDPELAKDLLLNMSKLIEDAKFEEFGNIKVADEINKDGTVRPVSKNTTFEMLGIPIGTKLEPVSDTFPPVTTADNINKVKLENGDVKAISNVAVEAYGDRKNGFAAYKYNGKSLDKIRKEMDKNYLPSHRR